MVGMGLQLIASLAVVVGLLLLIAKLSARRFGGRAGATVEVLARQSISRGSGVVVVRVGSRVLVLGSTEQQVSLLAEVDPEDVAPPPVERVEENDTEGEATITDFGELVARARHHDNGTLAGSIISPQTWRQAFQAVAGPRTTKRDAS
ncbi:flagellar biosynthetic protein FliO [Nocardioides stalactiti]|uniref:flagellar biosynthetic protein FliO n=1 Tax=Nocardioides stalactiti TaxID=2755356 RepID=UPI0015FFD39F|nr:flagellar biosynthetic protein FliO [Nocardioides stalactiti]